MPYNNYFDFLRERCIETSGLRMNILRSILHEHRHNIRFMTQLNEKLSLPTFIKTSLINEINTEIFFEEVYGLRVDWT